MIKLVIDIGNSFIKAAAFNNSDLLEIRTEKDNLQEIISSLIAKYGSVNSCIVSSVKEQTSLYIDIIKEAGIKKVISFHDFLKLPVTISYLTPNTLGTDRIANICGAFDQFKGNNLLIIDLGTCIKYDFLSADGNYSGGSISPGLVMRYKALHSFTGQLPYYKPINDFPALTGQSTEGSIRSGVEQGILAEIEGISAKYQDSFESLKIILTGGDCNRFEDKLKSPIFVAPNLTLKGLKVILDCNEL